MTATKSPPAFAGGLVVQSKAARLIVVFRGQERGRELGRGALVTIRTLAARAAIAAVSSVTTRTAIPVTAIPAGPTAFAAAVTVTATAIATVAARATVAAFTRFARWAGIFEFGTGFLVDEAHRQTNLAALVDFDQLDLHFLAFAEDVADVLDALVLDL